MENENIEETYKESREKARKLYRDIQHVWSPIFGENILFTSVGFQHLTRKNGFPRSKSEQKRRFALIPLAEEIVKNPNATVSRNTRVVDRRIESHGSKKSMSAEADFWIITERRDDDKIIVVIRQLNGGNKHFFSIY